MIVFGFIECQIASSKCTDTESGACRTHPRLVCTGGAQVREMAQLEKQRDILQQKVDVLTRDTMKIITDVSEAGDGWRLWVVM